VYLQGPRGVFLRKKIFNLSKNMADIINKVTGYVTESKNELKKVVWPSKKEAANHTLLVIGISLGVAILFGVLDYIFNLGLQRFISIK
jgi:preprotein translocase subunit SecE